MGVIKDIREFLTRHSLEESSVLVAVSGGVDSIVLLHALLELQSEFDLTLSVAHLDHEIRGETSRADARFVREEVKRLGLKLVSDRRPAAELQKREGLSLEEAAREVRYDFLTEAAAETNSDFVALGHNRDDQAETILMHLFRGAGLRGLGGMAEVSGRYLRPLLGTSKESIKTFAENHGLDYRIDETNEDLSYTRNRIRHELIPEIEEEFNSNLTKNLGNTGELAREAYSYVTEQTETVLDEIVISSGEGEIWFDRSKFSEHHPFLQKETLRRLIERAKGDLVDVASTHVEAVLFLLEEKSTRARLDLPGVTFVLRRNRAGFSREYGEKASPEFSYEIDPPGKIDLSEVDLRLIFEIRPFDEIESSDIPEDGLTEMVDWDKVERSLVIRTRNDGDRFVPLGMTGSKKLKDFFIDAKVPLEERDSTPLVCDSRGIVWVVGHRMDDRYKLDDSTRNVLIMKARDL